MSTEEVFSFNLQLILSFGLDQLPANFKIKKITIKNSFQLALKL